MTVAADLPPELATPEYLACFERVATARQLRTSWQTELAASSLTLELLFERSVDEGDGDQIVLATTRVLGLVESLPELGKVDSRRLLDSLDVDHQAQICDLSEEQRRGLIAATGTETHD